MSAELSVQAILNRCFNPTTNVLTVNDGTANPQGDTEFQSQEIVNRIFDSAANTLALQG